MQATTKIKLDAFGECGLSSAYLLKTGKGGNHTRESYKWNFLCPEFKEVLGSAANILNNRAVSFNCFQLPRTVLVFLKRIKEMHHV